MKKILLALNFITLKCFADSELYAGNEELKEVLNNNMYTPSYTKMFLGLAIVIGLIYVVGFIYQKLSNVKISNREANIYVPEIISTTTIGQGKNIHVIKVMNEYMLIASTQNNITFLKNLSEKEVHKEN